MDKTNIKEIRLTQSDTCWNRVVGNGLSGKSWLLRESSLSGALQLRARPENKRQDGGRPSPWLGGGGNASWERGVLGLVSKAPGFCIGGGGNDSWEMGVLGLVSKAPGFCIGGGGNASWEMGVLGLMSKAPGFCIDLRCFILLYRVKVSHLKIMFTNHNTRKDKAT